MHHLNHIFAFGTAPNDEVASCRTSTEAGQLSCHGSVYDVTQSSAEGDLSSQVPVRLSGVQRLSYSCVFLMKPANRLSVSPSQPVFRIMYILGISRFILSARLGRF